MTTERCTRISDEDRPILAHYLRSHPGERIDTDDPIQTWLNGKVEYIQGFRTVDGLKPYDRAGIKFATNFLDSLIICRKEEIEEEKSQDGERKG